MPGTVAIAASVALGVGLLVGAGVAILSIFIAPDLPATATLAGRVFWLLALLMPLSLWLGIYMTRDEDEHAGAYGSLLLAALTTVQAGLLGAALGAGPFYFLAASYLAGILRGFDAAQLSQAIRAEIFWGPWLWVIIITALAALPLAYWANRTSVYRV